jgi:dTMP kinase
VDSRGHFIVLEGIDGSGTTTQLDRLVTRLRETGRAAHPTREPSSGPIGGLLRQILMGQHRTADGAAIDGRTMALLFAADRVDHLQREIEPHLAAGNIVVSDRYLMSSLAYQAEEAECDWVSSLARGVRRPDLTVLLDVPVAVAAGRRRTAGRPTERYDADSTQARVADNYRRLAKADDRAVILDGTGSPDEVTDAIWGLVAPRFASSRSA